MSREFKTSGKIEAVMHNQADEGPLFFAFGTHTNVAHNDTVDTGLDSVLYCMCSLQDEPLITNTMFVSCLPGSGGNITITSQKPTGAGDVTPIDATTFGKKINWMAIGTKS